MKRFMVIVVLVVALLVGNVYAGETNAVDTMKSMTTTELMHYTNRILGTLASVEAKLALATARFNLVMLSLHQYNEHGRGLPKGETKESALSYASQLSAQMDKFESDVEDLKYLYGEAHRILSERRAM